MNRYFVITFAFLPVLVIAGVVILFVARPSDPGPSDAQGLEKEFELYKEVRQKLLEHYDGELDEKELMHAALKGLADGTGDRFTRVLVPVETRAQQLDLKGEFSGICVNVQPNEDGRVRIVNVIQYGGADKAGVRKDDVIIGVDGTSVLGQPYEATVLRIKSDEEGSKVALTLLRGGDPTSGTDPAARTLDIEVTRQRMETWSVHDVHIEERAGRRFGYLHISEFVSNTFNPQFKNAMIELTSQGAEGLIIDLRGNGGGQVTSASDIVDSLLSEQDALIAFTHSSRESNREFDRKILTKDDTAITELPVVVLIDEDTASASELVTGSLKDHGRAYVIGTRSYGKGVVQQVFELQTDPNYTVNITTTRYFTPLGRNVHQGQNGEPGGIQPDLEMSYKQGEKARVRARIRDRSARYNREEVRKESQWWNYDDRMLNAALDFLAGVPVVVK